MKEPWYMQEVPQVVRAGCYQVNWFRRLGRLQFVAIAWDSLALKERPGLTFTVRLDQLASNPLAISLVEEALASAQGMAKTAEELAATNESTHTGRCPE